MFKVHRQGYGSVIATVRSSTMRCWNAVHLWNRHRMTLRTFIVHCIVQESQTPQTDRASAFVVDRVQIFLTCNLITVQNLVVVSHTVRAHVTGPEIGRTMGPCPWSRDCGWRPGNSLLLRAITPYLVAGKLGPHTLGWERGWNPRNTLLPHL